jgi:hypothetical protein
MLVKIGSLSESEIASFFQALERPLFGVDSEVVKEVVPFPVNRSARCALKNFDLSPCLRVLVVVDSEFPGAWFFSTVHVKRSNVEIGSSYDLYPDVRGHRRLDSSALNQRRIHESPIFRLLAINRSPLLND